MKLPTAGLFSNSYYEPLSNHSEDNCADEKSVRAQRSFKTIFMTIFVLFISLVAALLGYVAGSHGGHTTQMDWLGQTPSFSA